MSGRAHVTRINGAPGTGKSTALENLVEREKANGVALDEMYYLTFSRSARDETVDRLENVFPAADRGDTKKRAKTFHGAACTTALIEGVIGEADTVIVPGREEGDRFFREFCRRNGMGYSGGKNPLGSSDGERYNSGDKAGDKFLTAYTWLKLTRKPPEKIMQIPVAPPMPRENAVRLCYAWESFKKNAADGRLFEHADYVDECIDLGLTPDVKVLFVDEFQDLSPQEYLLFKTWRNSGQIDRIYIAGDVNQSIYPFRAARPVFFAETDVDDEEYRTVSWRCPAEIVSVAGGLLEMCDETDPNDFSAHSTGGDVDRLRVESDADLSTAVREALRTHEPDETGNTVFLLTRTNKQARTIMSTLDREGVRYETLGSSPSKWADPLPSIYATLRQIRAAGDPSSLPDVVLRRLTSHLPGTKGRSGSEVWAELEDEPLGDIVSRLDLDYYDRERVRNAVLSGEHNKPEAVKVGTIHSSKGLEAPCVFLFDAYSRSLRQRYLSGETTADEHRLYYVGATRASETLRIVSGGASSSGEAFPPLDGKIPTADVAEVLA